MAKELGDKRTDRLLAMIEEGYQAKQRGELRKAETTYIKVWKALPAPHHQWNFSLTVARMLVSFFYENGRYREAKIWVKRMFQCEISAVDTSPDILAGQVYLDSGDKETAFSHFAAAHDRGKYRAFQGIDMRFWNFYKETKVKT